MCGRATLRLPVEEIAVAFDAAPPEHSPENAPGMRPRYNLSPGQPMLVVRKPRSRPGRALSYATWGLVPHWAASPKEGRKLAQARAETVARARPFKGAFARHRCIVVIDGFYEWQTPPGPAGRGAPRAPHHVTLPGGGLLPVAGLWERWTSPAGEVLETCAVVTTAAKDELARIHARMPLVLDEGDVETWLAGTPEDAETIAARPGVSTFEITPVSTWVNAVAHDDPRCVEPLAPPESLQVRLF